jgi:hypothetical protein
MSRFASFLAATVVLGFVTTVAAADDPTGLWKYTIMFGDQSREVMLTLKLEGDKLTGTVPGRNNTENPIEEGTFKDGMVSFKVTRTRNDQKFTTKYSGKLEGDTIKGTIESPGRDGQLRTREWTATRVKAN